MPGCLLEGTTVHLLAGFRKGACILHKRFYGFADLRAGDPFVSPQYISGGVEIFAFEFEVKIL